MKIDLSSFAENKYLSEEMGVKEKNKIFGETVKRHVLKYLGITLRIAGVPLRVSPSAISSGTGGQGGGNLTACAAKL